MTLKDSIKFHEGYKESIYKDTLGFDTIGYGFLVNTLTKDEIALNYGQIEPMGKVAADKILNLKLEKLKLEIFKSLQWLEGQDLAVQDILIEMAYQLGINGLLGFKNTLKMIESKDYENASINMLKSKWAMQTPSRAKELANRLKQCN